MATLAKPPSRPHRLVYFGTPVAAVLPLQLLVEAGFEIPLVITQPDRRRGRRGDLSPTPVKEAAMDLGIPVSSNIDEALDAEADLGVVVAFGQIIPTAFLEQLPMINLHFSLLPRWRGAAPVERAILAGDSETGVCVMRLEPALDTGAVYRTATISITDEATADSLRQELTEVGARLLVESLTDGLGDAREQRGAVRYARKIHPNDLELDFTRPAAELARVVRVGGAWTTFRGDRLKVWAAEAGDGDIGSPGSIGDDLRVATSDGVLELLIVQPSGKPRVAASSWVNGARLVAGEKFPS